MFEFIKGNELCLVVTLSKDIYAGFIDTLGGSTVFLKSARELVPKAVYDLNTSGFFYAMTFCGTIDTDCYFCSDTIERIVLTDVIKIIPFRSDAEMKFYASNK